MPMNVVSTNVAVNSPYSNVAITVESVVKYSVIHILLLLYDYIRIHYNSRIILPFPWSEAVQYVMESIKNGS